MGRIVIFANEAGFNITTQEGVVTAPDLMPWDELVRMVEEPAFTLSGSEGGFRITAGEPTEDQPLGSIQDMAVDELAFTNTDGGNIGHAAFRGGLDVTTRHDQFGAEDEAGVALDFASAFLPALAEAEFVFRGAEGEDHLDLSELQIGWTQGVRVNGASGDDALTGGTAGDMIRGGQGHDTLVGGAGDDTLDGNRGRDWIEGGAGDDDLRGGLGRDTFHFGQGATGADTISDFRVGRDVLSFGADVTSRDALRFEDRADGLLITQEDGDTVLLQRVAESMLTETDFLFI